MRSQRGYHIFRRYGITKDQFDQMVANQDNKCKICGNPPSMKTRKSSVLHVDHDHKTKKVRGLLCNRCNNALGIIEQRDLVAKAEAYLEAY
jgi:hypothetical protein